MDESGAERHMKKEEVLPGPYCIVKYMSTKRGAVWHLRCVYWTHRVLHWAFSFDSFPATMPGDGDLMEQGFFHTMDEDAVEPAVNDYLSSWSQEMTCDISVVFNCLNLAFFSPFFFPFFFEGVGRGVGGGGRGVVCIMWALRVLMSAW